MSLRVNYSNVEDQSVFLRGGEKNDNLIFMVGIYGLTAGISNITADNVDEFFARVNMFERLHGSLVKNSEGDAPLTREFANKLVGVNVNYGKDDTRLQWVKRVVHPFMDEVERGLRD